MLQIYRRSQQEHLSLKNINNSIVISNLDSDSIEEAIQYEI